MTFFTIPRCHRPEARFALFQCPLQRLDSILELPSLPPEMPVLVLDTANVQGELLNPTLRLLLRC
jgi:hypothetical protein